MSLQLAAYEKKRGSEDLEFATITEIDCSCIKKGGHTSRAERSDAEKL